MNLIRQLFPNREYFDTVCCKAKFHRPPPLQDMFFNLAPIAESPGMALMKKMGWEQGKGLGKDETGNINPLELSVKCDKKGIRRFVELFRIYLLKFWSNWSLNI